jgi:hypothetical protein
MKFIGKGFFGPKTPISSIPLGGMEFIFQGEPFVVDSSAASLSGMEYILKGEPFVVNV